MDTIWTLSNPEKFEWVNKFKDIFINQKFNEINSLFNEEIFGIHNSLTMKEYCDAEFEEFSFKCEKFGLTLDATVACYDLKNNLFYFSLGKKEDKAVFEAIFTWDEQTKKAIGNQYFFKIEPKTQFIKNLKTNEIETFRRINIKPVKNNEINQVIQLNPKGDTQLNKIALEDYLGGIFYDFNYKDHSDNKKTFWDKINIYSTKGKFTQEVLMRGEDHPLFIPNLFPTVSSDLLTLSFPEDVYPVIIYVLTQDGKEHFYKYPENKSFNFNTPIVNACLTDNLSFDWIINP